jgi:hypothetical protein
MAIPKSFQDLDLITWGEGFRMIGVSKHRSFTVTLYQRQEDGAISVIVRKWENDKEVITRLLGEREI